MPSRYRPFQALFGKLNEDVGFGKSTPAKAAAQFLADAKKSLDG